MRSHLPFVASALAVFLPFLFRGDEASWEFEVPAPPAAGETPYFNEEFLPSDPRATHVHAASIEFARDGRPMAVWFGGGREGGADVAVWFSVRDPAGWSQPRPLIERTALARALRRHVRRIGNPLLSRDAHGHLRLHFVSTSAGGWSTAALNAMTSDDDGATWSPPRRLVTAPFVNLGTLLRAPVVEYTDGRRAIPAYHELFGRFGDLIVLDRNGDVAARRRMNWGRSRIQPAVVPLSGSRAVAFFRDRTAPGNVWRAETSDGGRTWSPEQATELPNPDSGIAALALGGERLLLAYNDEATSRRSLALALSDDAGRSWRKVRTVARSEDYGVRFAYPALARRPDGRIQLLFTWKRERIRSIVFNRAWLEAGE